MSLGPVASNGSYSGIYALLSGISGAFIVVIVALGIALARTREQVAKLQEWTRIHEQKHHNGEQK